MHLKAGYSVAQVKSIRLGSMPDSTMKQTNKLKVHLSGAIQDDTFMLVHRITCALELHDKSASAIDGRCCSEHDIPEYRNRSTVLG